MSLADLFPEEDYQLRMRFQRGGITEFFQATQNHEALRAQRSHWLGTSPNTYAALLPEGEPLLEETLRLARHYKTVGDELSLAQTDNLSPWQRCLALGASWEPDYLLLQPDHGGELRLLGGCVCFPSSWSLAEKIGRPLDFIHAVVPGLNAQLGKQINGFLAKIKPGIAWMRVNWGLSRSPELNQHPDRKLPRLDASVLLDEVWLRVEDQALLALPESGGVLFGIRIRVYPLVLVKTDSVAALRLAHALKTMPAEMAAYKNLSSARSKILSFLSATDE